MPRHVSRHPTRKRTILRDLVMPMLIGATIAGALVYMVAHPSSCRYEEVC